MPSYSQQIVIATGKDDWASRIVDDKDAVLARELKRLLGRGGRYHDVRKAPQCSSFMFTITGLMEA